MTVICVISDKPGAGKTALCSVLSRILKEQGHQVHLVKPLTPADSTELPDPDITFFRTLTSEEYGEQVDPVSASDRGSSRKPNNATLEETLSYMQEISQKSDVVIEGLSLTSDDSEDQQAIVEKLDSRVLIILRHNPTMTTEHIEQLIEPFRDRLIGIIFNAVTRYRIHALNTELVPTIEARGIKVLGTIPEDRTLIASTVGQLADHLRAEWLLFPEKVDQLVEHFMVGGLILDDGTLYFGRRDHKAVFVRGDRPDIQMPALETSTATLVLTGGKKPLPYIYNEAVQTETPLLVVPGDTSSVLQELETLHTKVTFSHPKKVERFYHLVEENIDLKPIQVGP